MRIEVTYIDDSEPKKRLKFHLPKRRTPQPAPQPPVEQAKRAKPVKPAKLAKATAPAKPKPKSPKPVTQRRGLPRPVRNVLVSATVLLVLLLGAGVAYTYFMGGSATQPIDTQAAAVKSYQPTQPKAPSPNALVGVAVESLSSPVSPGSSAFMAVHTLATATCAISVEYGSGTVKVKSMAAGLHNVTADAYGSASWTWTVDPSAPLGTWPVTVTCKHNTHDGVVQGDLQVVSPGSATLAN